MIKALMIFKVNHYIRKCKYLAIFTFLTSGEHCGCIFYVFINRLPQLRSLFMIWTLFFRKIPEERNDLKTEILSNVRSAPDLDVNPSSVEVKNWKKGDRKLKVMPPRSVTAPNMKIRGRTISEKMEENDEVSKPFDLLLTHPKSLGPIQPFYIHRYR